MSVARVGYKHGDLNSKTHLGATKHSLIGLIQTPYKTPPQNVLPLVEHLKTPILPAMNSESKEMFTHMRLRKGGRSLEVSLPGKVQVLKFLLHSEIRTPGELSVLFLSDG